MSTTCTQSWPGPCGNWSDGAHGCCYVSDHDGEHRCSCGATYDVYSHRAALALQIGEFARAMEDEGVAVSITWSPRHNGPGIAPFICDYDPDVTINLVIP